MKFILQYLERLLYKRFFCYGYCITSEGVMTAPLVLWGLTFSE